MTSNVCKSCGEAFEPGYDTCWNCCSHLDGSPPDETLVSEQSAVDVARKARREVDCLRCNCRMHHVRRMRFHEGTRVWPFLLAELGELFVNREAFDAYACPECGKVEFFLGAAE